MYQSTVLPVAVVIRTKATGVLKLKTFVNPLVTVIDKDEGIVVVGEPDAVVVVAPATVVVAPPATVVVVAVLPELQPKPTATVTSKRPVIKTSDFFILFSPFIMNNDSS